MATYEVKLKGDSHYIIGLKDSWDDGDDAADTLLLIRYDAGDCDTRMKDKGTMHRALYDLYQCHEGLKEGDVFVTEFGNFKCLSLDVVESHD